MPLEEDDFGTMLQPVLAVTSPVLCGASLVSAAMLAPGAPIAG
ncbi:MAG: hypothetical protein ACLQB1_05595 [Streptosporangiaceae bacterium]